MLHQDLRGLSPSFRPARSWFGLTLRLSLMVGCLSWGAGFAQAGHSRDHSDDEHFHDHWACRHGLGEDEPRPFQFHGSGQDASVNEEHYEMAKHIYEVATSLGYDIPNHHIRTLSATDMAALSSTGGHPTPTWSDGLDVLRSTYSAAGILEFVVGGEIHQQFIRDTNSPEEMRVVLAHVGGHYDFNVNTHFFRSRDADQMRYSYELATYMIDLFRTESKAEVQLFYQRLLTIKFQQDLSRGSFDPGQSPLTRPTQGVLQALVANPPIGWTPWQKRMAELFERNNRVLPAYVQTKFMNEGWATISEYIILGHSKYNTSSDLVSYGSINSGVRVPKLSNPYWLGCEAWMRLRERFSQRPDIQALAGQPLEQDRRFVAYAHEIIRTHSDYSFLRMALDETWVRHHGLFLQRNLTPEEQGALGSAQQPVPNRISITRDATRVVNNIAHRIANRDFVFPKIELMSFNDRYTGRVLYHHEPRFGIPLKRTSMVKALYESSHVFQRPVTLETIASSTWFPQRRTKQPDEGRQWWWQPPQPAVPEVFPIKITVDPQGTVTVEAEAHLLTPVETADLKTRFERVLRKHQFDTQLTFPSQGGVPGENTASFNPGIMRSILSVVQLQSSPDFLDRSIRLQSHAPTARDAIRAYHEAAAERVYVMLRLMAKGKIPFDLQGQSIQVQVFGEIPVLELDRGLYEKRNKYLRHTPPDSLRTGAPGGIVFPTLFQGTPHAQNLTVASPQSQQLSFADMLSRRNALEASAEEAARTRPVPFPVDQMPDEDTNISSGDRVPGSIWNEKDDDDQGDGDGEDEADGEEADGDEPSDKPGKPTKPKPGEGGQGENPDPSVISVPIEVYGQILAEEIELRNLRRTQGESLMTDELHEDTVRRPTGQLIPNKTAQNAAGLGISLLKGKATRGFQGFRRALLEGLKHMTPAQHVVRDWAPQPVPDMDAVMVWVRDTSGSMTQDKVRAISNLVANTRAVLRVVHPHLKERFVIYSSGAQEVSEKEFFSMGFMGGTETVKGVQKAAEILEEFPYERFNRLVSLFSDGDDGSMESVEAEVAKLLPSLEHFAYGHIDGDGPAWGTGAMSNEFEALSKREPQKVGFARVNGNFSSILKALRIFYGKK